MPGFPKSPLAPGCPIIYFFNNFRVQLIFTILPGIPSRPKDTKKIILALYVCCDFSHETLEVWHLNFLIKWKLQEVCVTREF